LLKIFFVKGDLSQDFSYDKIFVKMSAGFFFFLALAAILYSGAKYFGDMHNKAW
jgi:hypothetical protein